MGRLALTGVAAFAALLATDVDAQSSCAPEGPCVTPMTVAFVRVHGKQSDTRLGNVTVRSRFVTEPPDELRVTQGVRARVQDAGGLDQSFFWPPEDCRVRPGAGALCVTASRKAQIFRGNGYYGVKLRLLKLDIQGPFAAPVTVTLTQDGDVERVGSISTCQPLRNDTMQCR